ncbi:LytR C-terminal domain-containing protein [Thalassiella azotivora]
MTERRTYPPDEFDRVQGPPARRGAHRGRPSPVLAALPVVAVLAVVGGVAWGFSTLLGDGRVESAISAPAGDETVAPAPQDPATEPAPGTDPGTVAPEPTVEPTPTATVDRDVTFRVLNSTTVGGLAARGAQALEDAGWTVSGTDNYRAGEMDTTVFYNDPGLEATAAAIAEDLGGALTTLDPNLEDDLSVILGADFD